MAMYYFQYTGVCRLCHTNTEVKYLGEGGGGAHTPSVPCAGYCVTCLQLVCDVGGRRNGKPSFKHVLYSTTGIYCFDIIIFIRQSMFKVMDSTAAAELVDA